MSGRTGFGTHFSARGAWHTCPSLRVLSLRDHLLSDQLAEEVPCRPHSATPPCEPACSTTTEEEESHHQAQQQRQQHPLSTASFKHTVDAHTEKFTKLRTHMCSDADAYPSGSLSSRKLTLALQKLHTPGHTNSLSVPTRTHTRTAC
jgi:hypothetical protein